MNVNGARAIILAAGIAVLSLVLISCVSEKSQSTTTGGLNDDLTPLWQNAGATPASPPAAAFTPSPVAPPPPASTLEPSITTVGGTVSTKPGYAQYDFGWPRTFMEGGSTNTLYQPQVDSWTGMVLRARAAVSIQAAGMAEPTFGVLHVQALTHVDKVERLVYFEDIQILDANFPSAVERKKEYEALWLGLLKKDVRSISLDRVAADLAVQGAEKKAQAVPILSPPPAFICSAVPAMLIQVQGEAVFRKVAGTDVERILNTRAFIARVPSSQIYLHLWDGYVTAPNLTGPWTVAGDVPKDVTKAEKEAVKEKSVDLLGGQANPDTGEKPSLKTAPLPTIHVATIPTELVVTDGPANWLPIAGTELLYVTNTAANVFKYLADDQTYVLVAGRWFRAPDFGGPWAFVSGKELPQDFARIPATSAKENVLASVPGTPQAQQAIIENEIPQTAKVDRSATHMTTPVFDGAPLLQPIAGTPLYYVANTATPLIKVDDHTWYALENCVWFAATSANGPWVVATSVPAVIYSIPPSAPLHYVTYVRIYTYNNNYVWNGYTPGYYGTVLAPDGVVVYGTGYDYSPWVGTIYIAPPITYGYYASLAWTPWAGWGYSFAAGWAWGASWSFWCGTPCAPFWGPYYGWCHGAYFNGYGGMTAWGPGGWAATTGNMYSHWGNWSSVSRGGAGYNAWTGRGYAYQYGHAYNSVTGTMAAGQRGAVQNVYTGNYAHGGRGAAYNPNTGRWAAGSRYTVGNAYSGKQATFTRGEVSGPGGHSTYVSGARGASGGMYDVGGHTLASNDGNIYHQNGNGGWDKYNTSGGWDKVQSFDQNHSLSSSVSAQNFGSQHASSWENHGWQDSGGSGGGSHSGDSGGGFGRGNHSWDSGGDHSWGGGDHSFGGGGWGGGDHSWGGFGGGGFGGFRGGGFGGFRR